MTIEKLSTLHHSQPFRPFRIHRADGRFVDVEHPTLLFRSPAGRTVVFYIRDETFEIIDVLLVSSLDLLNGQTRSRG